MNRIELMGNREAELTPLPFAELLVSLAASANGLRSEAKVG